MNTNKKNYAVLTGDIVDSSDLSFSELNEVMNRLRKGVKRFKDNYPKSIFGNLDVYSGDSWQIMMPDWRRSLRAALFLRCIIKGIEKLKLDTRVAIAWGDIEEESLNPERISESTGTAFQNSGRSLEKMSKDSRMSLVIEHNPEKWGVLPTAIFLLDEIVTDWKNAQANTIALALLEKTQEDIAEELRVKQPTVQKSIHRGCWQSVKKFIEEIENR